MSSVIDNQGVEFKSFLNVLNSKLHVASASISMNSAITNEGIPLNSF